MAAKTPRGLDQRLVLMLYCDTEPALNVWPLEIGRAQGSLGSGGCRDALVEFLG